MQNIRKGHFILFQFLIIILLSFQTSTVNAQGEDPSNAIVIILGDTFGNLPGPSTDGSVWYSITLTAGDYQISITAQEGTDFDLDMYDNSLGFIEGGYHDYYPDRFFALDLAADTYFINVYAISGTGAFTLNVAKYTRVPGDNYDNPIRTYSGNTIGNMLGPGIDGEIYYVVSLSANDYQFTLTGPGGTNFDLYLFDSNGNNIGIADDFGYPDLLIALALQTGTYLVVIFPVVGTGTFILNIAIYTAPTGDSPSDAIPITMGVTTGEMPGPGPNGRIWYVVGLDAGDYRWSLTGTSGTDFNLDLYDTDLHLIGSANDTLYPDILTILDLKLADYFISILSITGTGAFTLNIGDATPGKSSDNAIPIGLGNTTGYMPGPGLYGEIWYFLQLVFGDFQFSLNGPKGTNYDFYLYNSSFYSIGEATGDDYPDDLLISNLEAGDYYIAVIASNGTGSFMITITEYAPIVDESPENVTPIELGETIGYLPGSTTDGSIWYNLTLNEGDYNWSLTGPDGTDFNLELYDSALSYVAGTYDVSYPDILILQDLAAGIYYVNIISNRGEGEFTLMISEYTSGTSRTIPTTPPMVAKTTTTSATPISTVLILITLLFPAIIKIHRRRPENIPKNHA
ncbi:MAG: hypothetical protein ACFFE8_04580 [Candidatus Heimdallarchaeota archaeon]